MDSCIFVELMMSLFVVKIKVVNLRIASVFDSTCCVELNVVVFN